MQQEFSPVTLPEGVNFLLVYPNQYSAKSFNPNTDGNLADDTTGGRFHPFESAKGERVPTKYAADHSNGAFAETLMSDDSLNKMVTINQIEKNNIATIKFRRDLLLVDLTPEEIDNDIQDLLQSGRKAYSKLRTLAASIHKLYPKIDGMRWYNKQLGTPGMYSYVFFSGKACLQENDIEIIYEYPLTEGEGLRMLRSAASSLGYRLPQKYSVKPF